MVDWSAQFAFTYSGDGESCREYHRSYPIVSSVLMSRISIGVVKRTLEGMVGALYSYSDCVQWYRELCTTGACTSAAGPKEL